MRARPDNRVPVRNVGRLRIYMITVTVAGYVLVAALLANGGAAPLVHAPIQFWVLAMFVLLGELLKIKVPGRDDEIAGSTPFLFAILLGFGTTPALVVQALASLLVDLQERRPPLRAGFNAAHQSIAVAASGLVLGLVTDLPRIDNVEPLADEHIPGILAAALVFFAARHALAATAPALAQKAPILRYLKRDLGFQAMTAAVFLSIAPLIVVAAEIDLASIALLLFPLVAIYRGGQHARVNEYWATHDHLTGLPNRTLFERKLEETLSHEKGGGRAAVMLMDLDHFKEINDTLGHHHGDLVLQQIGPRIGSAVRDGDTVARIGGDEFAVLIPRASVAAAESAAKRILAALEQPLEVDGLAFEVAASIGIACSPQHGDNVDVLLQRADVAMFLAKEARNSYELYSRERDHYSPDRLALAGEMRRAVESDEVTLHYQPMIDVASRRLVGAEALARWNHPTRGAVAPQDFIAVAEQTGLIRPLTLKFLASAVEAARSWREAGLDLYVAINISARNLLDQGLPEQIARLLDERSASPSWLKLELTESTIMTDPKRAMTVLTEMSSMGVKIAIDDFGTGYSSLEYLRRLPVDEMKIDQSFVTGMSSNVGDAMIVRSMIDLGHSLGLEVVAEGVDSEVVLEELASLGCDAAQGYHFRAPMPAGEFFRWACETLPAAEWSGVTSPDEQVVRAPLPTHIARVRS